MQELQWLLHWGSDKMRPTTTFANTLRGVKHPARVIGTGIPPAGVGNVVNHKSSNSDSQNGQSGQTIQFILMALATPMMSTLGMRIWRWLLKGEAAEIEYGLNRKMYLQLPTQKMADIRAGYT